MRQSPAEVATFDRSRVGTELALGKQSADTGREDVFNWGASSGKETFTALKATSAPVGPNAAGRVNVGGRSVAISPPQSATPGATPRAALPQGSAPTVGTTSRVAESASTGADGRAASRGIAAGNGGQRLSLRVPLAPPGTGGVVTLQGHVGSRASGADTLMPRGVAATFAGTDVQDTTLARVPGGGVNRPTLPQISPPGGPDLVVPEDGGGRRGKGGSELQNAATAWLQSQNLAQEARRTQARANEFADGAYVAQRAMREAEQSYLGADQDASEAARSLRQSNGDAGNHPTSNVAAHNATEVAKASADEALKSAQQHRKQLGYLVTSANAADEAAAELNRASARASADFQQLTAKLKTSIPGQWQRRLDDELERQSKETYKSQVGRGLLMADTAQQRLVGRVEARGDRDIRAAGSNLAARVEARTSSLQRELDVHAMRSSSLSGLDAEQARLSAKVADGTASATDRRMERKLREGKSHRDRERADNLARDISSVASLIASIEDLIKKKSDSGDDAAASSLQVQLNELHRLQKKLTAQKEELERRLAAENAQALIDYHQLLKLLNPPFVVRLHIEPIIALSKGLQLRFSPQLVSKVRPVSPEGGIEAGGLVVNLSPDHAGFGTTSIIPSQGFDSDAAGPPSLRRRSRTNLGSPAPNPVLSARHLRRGAGLRVHAQGQARADATCRAGNDAWNEQAEPLRSEFRRGGSRQGGSRRRARRRWRNWGGGPRASFDGGGRWAPTGGTRAGLWPDGDAGRSSAPFRHGL